MAIQHTYRRYISGDPIAVEVVDPESNRPMDTTPYALSMLQSDLN